MTTGAAPKSFAEILSASRREAGYPSARDFYRTVGGRPVLGCTYAQYRNVESGRSMPKPAFVRAVLSFLESKPGDARARETVTAYLRAVLKDDDFLALALEALTPPGPSPIPDDAPMRQALRRNEEARQVRLTHEQAEAIEGDERAYWCFKVFSNDDGDWGTLDLGRLLGYDARAVRAALDRLGRAGLVVKTPEG
ncbi:MAG: hypothetical protein HY079_14270, partial [Elusimicrobia bacterium]|nr:hypothetical protein [Elusimicrobiota bacterium]